MKSVTLDWSNLHHHGDLWWRLLAHRHDVFVTQKGWDIPIANRSHLSPTSCEASETVEFDQYDSPWATYIIILDDTDQIAASARLVRTDAHYRFGPYDVTYMIKDASRGLLQNLPTGLTHASCPTDPAKWEITRYTSLSRKASKVIAEALNTYLDAMGATSMLSLSPTGFERWYQAIGFEVEKIGPDHRIDDSSFSVFETKVRSKASSTRRQMNAKRSQALRGSRAANILLAAE